MSSATLCLTLVHVFGSIPGHLTDNPRYFRVSGSGLCFAWVCRRHSSNIVTREREKKKRFFSSRSRNVCQSLLRFPEDQPVTVLAPTVVGGLPFGVDNGALSNLYDAVARQELGFPRGANQLDVGPLIAVMVHVVGNLAKEHSLWFQHPVSLPQKRRKGGRPCSYCPYTPVWIC